MFSSCLCTGSCVPGATHAHYGGQLNRYLGTGWRAIADRDAAVVLFHNLLHDREPQPRTLDFRRHIRFAGTRENIGREARAVIAYALARVLTFRTGRYDTARRRGLSCGLLRSSL